MSQIMVVISAQHALICVRLFRMLVYEHDSFKCAPFAASLFPISLSQPAVHLF